MFLSAAKEIAGFPPEKRRVECKQPTCDKREGPSSKMFSPSFILPTSPSYGPDSPISSQTPPSCSRTASCNSTSDRLEPSCSSPSYAFTSEAPPLSFFYGAATPDAPSLEVPTISPLTIPEFMPAELEELLTDALEQMTEDQARASRN